MFLLLPVFAGGDAGNVNVVPGSVLWSVPSLVVLRRVAPGDSPGPGVDGAGRGARGAREARVGGGVTRHLLALDTGGVGWLARGVAGSGIAWTVERLGGRVAGTGTCWCWRVAGSTGGVACSGRVDSTGTVAGVAWRVLGGWRVLGSITGRHIARAVCGRVTRGNIAGTVVGSVARGLRVGGSIAGCVAGSEARHVGRSRVGGVTPGCWPVVLGRSGSGVKGSRQLGRLSGVSRGVARRDLPVERSEAGVVAVGRDVYAVRGGVGGDVAGRKDLREDLERSLESFARMSGESHDL